MSQPHIRGSIARGKKADFVLVDRDTLTVSPEELKDTKVIWAKGNGKIVYRSSRKQIWLRTGIHCLWSGQRRRTLTDDG